MSTVISGHVHGCDRPFVKARVAEVEYLEFYDPKEYEHTLPFPTGTCNWCEARY